MVQLIDQQMGRILEALDSLGLADNTLVIFTSDHGELLGDHGIWMKGPFHYEPLVRVPALMRWPRGLPGGQVVDGLFSLADIVPTCLAAAGVDTSSALDGHDALPLLRGEVDCIREDVLIESVDDLHKLRAKTIVSASHKLTWYAGQTYGELYDLTRDPREKRNLWLDQEYTGVKVHLLGRLLDYAEQIEPHQPRLVYA